ncbi:T9SS type B sorting domain-containing protein [Flavivirga amylovorans]|uniref:T9SS type B sorting domain-containing protein n=1 Tax=Flavivirga amylovorans TaxID=870486 RepID=A0ABT8X6F3_9FLAO|nr:T9SS type B sorting domain-containing protein [Flavivirga amylovorans]MDO5989412.1 T9SS type B sorting domain-containing protein [Flavivirga amylovorans]
MMKKIITFTILCFSLHSYAQNEASNWYFGSNAGIRFNPNGTITELTDGQLNTDEGCTTISDVDGNLLFYTDGITVWDRLHRPMPNANGIAGNGLYGDPSSTQSAIVIPKPKDPNIYYIFTADTSLNGDPDLGFHYSEVDMRLNGTFGDVISKNINLLLNSTEKISAVVKDCNTQALWVITLSSLNGNPADTVFNTFHAYEVTDTGIQTTPVSSTFNDLAVIDQRGYLKLSPDGTKLACANSVDGLFLYDFDVDTGIVSNQEKININFSRPGKRQSPYGIEFSQNNNILYVTTYYNPETNEELRSPAEQYGALLQYDLTATNINTTEVVIDNRQTYRGSLQLGPDGRIYRAMSITYPQGSPFLSVINNPNVLGTACNYEHNAIRLSRNSRQGLPPFITSFFAQKIDIIGNNSTSTRLQLCEGDTYTLKADDIAGATYLWTLDGVPLSETNYFLEVNASDLLASGSGLYKVFIDLNTGKCDDTYEGIATVGVNANPIAYDAVLTQCDEDGILGGFTRFDLTQAYDELTGGLPELSTRFFTDSSMSNDVPNSNDYIYDADNPSPVYVEVYNTNTNCSNTSILTLNLSHVNIPSYEHPVCDELESEDGINTFNLDDITTDIQTTNSFTFPIIYYETYEYALLEENNIKDVSYTNKSPYNQTIYARIENNNACFGIVEVTLIVNKLPDIDTEDLTYFYCLNESPQTIPINALIPSNVQNDYTYSWSTGENSYEIQINEPKNYVVTATNTITGCSKKRTVIVLPSNVAIIQEINVVDVSQNNTITVMASGEGEYEYRLLDENNTVVFPYQESNIFENVSPGIYTVTVNDVKNDCGPPVNEKFSVIGFPKFFTPNNDGRHDTWQVYGVSSMFQPNTKIRIFNRYGKLIKQLTPLGEGWDGTSNGEKLPVDDYWFDIVLQDGRVFKNHFTLKY